jgi:uncharacterized membrane protein (DUF4010 family)
MDHQLYIQLAYALGIGLLVGLERTLQQVTEGAEDAEEQPNPAAPGEGAESAEASKEREAKAEAKAEAQSLDEFMGLRTFAVLSLLGFGAALVGEKVPFLGPVVVGGVCLLVVAMYVRVVHWGTGITTEAAAIAVCVLGMLCRYNAQAAGVIALVLAVLLASKRFTHGTARKMRRVELTDTLKFLVVILIILPLLPHRALDPYGAFNPYKVGFLVVLISGISFVGYFLTRILGAQRGLGLTGILGGLTSSTAVTAAMAAQAKQHPKLRSICAFSTVAANATMFARVLVVVAVLDRALVLRLVWSIGAMTGVAIIASVVLWFVASKATKADAEAAGEVPLKNPFSVGPALKFAAFFVGILFVAKLSKLYLGDQGLYAAAALSGLADVDAITLTITEQTRNASLAQHVGAVGITIAVVSNSVVKTGIAIYSGGWKFGRLIGVCLGLATAAGLAVVFLLP